MTAATHLTVSAADLHRYAACSHDDNPIHLDGAAARAAGLPGRVAHGMLVMGLAVETVARRVGGPARIAACSARFLRPLVVPETGTVPIAVMATAEGAAVHVAVHGPDGLVARVTVTLVDG
ncbi:acyl dehydratase [Dactylosporangium vinaceum]|uniref:MaoC/PaaZ C-terminal domain-containing protein n=1 Tax=Dactylosporangium vinaceum TaxID=53362 RepID=A0ABV5M389_9ACTN|nr:MaoC/PaaZ C-terminal domain-containing protein [Dactylosporangium vinaceum]UAB99750.1 acyl dehydratase [Dactylosporangium vinaceum]